MKTNQPITPAPDSMPCRPALPLGRWRFGLAFLASCLMWAGFIMPAHAQITIVGGDCHALEWRRNRPYDYYAPETRQSTGTFPGGLLTIVEHHHFNRDVQSLRRGQTAPLPGDLMFVLTTIPNHATALDIYSNFEKRYSESEPFRSSSQIRRPAYNAECFFERATRTFPNHGETFMVWGVHRHRFGDYAGAVEKYQRAQSLGYRSPVLEYNLGLSYLELGDLEAASRHERRARDMGYTLQGLRNRIEQQSGATSGETTTDD